MGTKSHQEQKEANFGRSPRAQHPLVHCWCWMSSVRNYGGKCLPCKLQCVVTQETNAHSVTRPSAARSVPRLAYTAVECKRKLEFWFCFECALSVHVQTGVYTCACQPPPLFFRHDLAVIPLPQTPKRWDFRHVPPYLPGLIQFSTHWDM